MGKRSQASGPPGGSSLAEGPQPALSFSHFFLASDRGTGDSGPPSSVTWPGAQCFLTESTWLGIPRSGLINLAGSQLLANGCKHCSHFQNKVEGPYLSRCPETRRLKDLGEVESEAILVVSLYVLWRRVGACSGEDLGVGAAEGAPGPPPCTPLRDHTGLCHLAACRVWPMGAPAGGRGREGGQEGRGSQLPPWGPPGLTNRGPCGGW